MLEATPWAAFRRWRRALLAQRTRERAHFGDDTFDPAEVARGTRHVRAGVAIIALTSVAAVAWMFGLQGLEGGPTLRSALGLATSSVVFCLALLHGSRVARWISIVVGGMYAVGAVGMLALLGVDRSPLALVMSLVAVTIAAGFLLASATGPASTYHAWRIAERRHRRERVMRTLDEWRAGDQHPNHEPHA